MKRSPIKRTAMRRKSRSTKYSRRERDFEYMGWVKQQPCSMIIMPPLAPHITACSGGIEAHHAGVRGLGQKASDDTCIALCSRHHGELTDRRGTFAGWERGVVKSWELAAVSSHRTRYALRVDVDF